MFELGQLVEQPPQRSGAEVPGHRLLRDVARLLEPAGAAMRVGEVRLGKRVRRIATDGLFGLCDRGIVFAQPVQQDRQGIRRPVHHAHTPFAEVVQQAIVRDDGGVHGHGAPSTRGGGALCRGEAAL